MLNDQWGVAKVKGVDPEHFFIFLKNAQGFDGPFMRISDFFSEDELRSELKTKGSSETEIESLIERARANPA
jgi:mannitol/fructose-specific phosphotransferase system IIA component (Ntr-type)